MTKEQTNLMIDEIGERITILMNSSFELVRKLASEEYSSPWDQVNDMIKIGELAQAMNNLSDTRSNLYTLRGMK